MRERGIVTITPDCALPSLFAACHEPPYRPGSRGFGLWPRTKYPWAVELTAHPGILGLKIHRGKRVLVSDAVAALLDPLCRAALDAARDSPLVAHLRSAGPSLVDDLRVELGLSAAALRRLREPLERTGAIVTRSVTVPAATGGHRHTSELRLWPQAETPVPGTNVSPGRRPGDPARGRRSGGRARARRTRSLAGSRGRCRTARSRASSPTAGSCATARSARRWSGRSRTRRSRTRAGDPRSRRAATRSRRRGPRARRP